MGRKESNQTNKQTVVSRFVLPCICTKDPNRTALSDVECLFLVIVYLNGIQVTSFDAIFDCYLNMIGFFLFANCQVDAM